MKRIKEDIKKHTFHNTYLLYGEEDYLKRLYRDRLKEAVLADSDQMNCTYMEGRDFDFDELVATGDTLPFFSDFRIILIEDSGLFKKANDLPDYLERMPDTTILVFVEKEVDKRNKLYKYINKHGIAAEMNGMTPKELKSWLGVLLKENRRKMRESTADYLLERIDNSMSNIQNEMEKLFAYTLGREEITQEDIDAVCCPQPTGHIFQMMDAVAGGNTQEVMKMYRELLALRESPMSILYLLSRHFNILLQVKELEGQARGVIAKKAGVPPFTVGKYQAQCRHFTGQRLREMLEACMETEYQFKRGNLQDQLGVEMLLLTFLQQS